MPNALFDLLHRCTVKIGVPNDWGTGFFVAPGQVMTCAHVVKQHPVESIRLFQHGAEVGTVTQIHRPESRDIDVVLLSVSAPAATNADAQPCVQLGDGDKPDDALYVYGFPSDFQTGAPTTGGVYEGETADERGPLSKFRGMQIQPGHSGAALLNRSTGLVCGVVNKTRGAATDLGGVAVPVGEIWQAFPDLRSQNQTFHQHDRQWAAANAHVREQHQAQGTGQRFHVPFLQNVYFTGRDEVLLHLHERLQSGNAVINQTQGISGLGGIGKTQTAVEYAYRYAEVAYDWVFWLRADTLVNLRTDLGAVARHVGTVADPNLELDQQIQAALQWLNTHPHWLLVVDNADSDEVLAALPDYLPNQSKGRVLITSRQSVLDGVNVADPLPLGTWTREASVDFLLNRTQRRDTDTERTHAEQVAEKLGDLPLALEQAAAYMVRRKCSFLMYAQQYETLRLRSYAKIT
ncbi:MAG: trypsin-like peptidase domain-containing protein [Cyanobacteria bacterium P01_A01_bin.37]